jgi:signal peptidase I
MWKYIADLAITIVVAVLVFLGLQLTVGAFKVYGNSSYPNIQSGDYLIIDKVTYHFHSPSRGDMVILNTPYAEGTGLIKRIIGMPGDTVEIHDCKVYIDGVELEEPYLCEPTEYVYPEEKIPEGSYFVLGDNRNVSLDSHDGWLVSRAEITGKAWFIYWPVQRIQLVAGYDYKT